MDVALTTYRAALDCALRAHDRRLRSSGWSARSALLERAWQSASDAHASSRRRHEREGQRRRDRRGAAARARPARRPVHVAAPRRLPRAHPRRPRSDRRGRCPRVSRALDRRTVERLGATFFEATTALAFDYFATANVDVAVVETGLGGRLDATNVVTPRRRGGHVDRARSHRVAGRYARGDRRARRPAIFKAGRPAVIGEREAGDCATLLAQIARSERRAARGLRRAIADRSRTCRSDRRERRSSSTATSPIDGSTRRCSARTRRRTPRRPWSRCDAAGFVHVAARRRGSGRHPSGRRSPAAFSAWDAGSSTSRTIPTGADVLADTLRAVAPARPLVVAARRAGGQGLARHDAVAGARRRRSSC